MRPGRCAGCTGVQRDVTLSAMRARRAAAALLVAALALAAAADPAPVPDRPPTSVSPETARRIGVQAIAENRPELALALAAALVRSNARDPFAHYLLAQALRRLNRLPEAQSAARSAFRLGESREQRYQAARLTALVAYDRERYGAAQWWLRQAAQSAPEAARRARSIAEFGAVRARNPLSIDLRFSLVPSDNVNNGSSGSFNTIDGVPYVGTLSPDAQALSGVIAEAGVTLNYRLRQTSRSATFIGAKANIRAVTLSPAAKEALGATPAPDLGSQRLELSLSHSVTPEGSPARLNFAATLGRLWQTGVEPQDLLRLSAGYTRAVSPATLLDFGLSLEQRERTDGRPRGDRVLSFQVSATHRLPKAGLLSGALFCSFYDTPLSGRSSSTIGARIAFAPAKDLGPARLSVNFGLQRAEFDGYALAGILVPGGRVDTMGYGELQVWFPKMQYMGFAPELSLRHQTTRSNVSRFQTSETSVTLGIRSTF